MTADTLIFFLIVGAVFVSIIWAVIIIIFKVIKAIKRLIGKKIAIKEKINPTEFKISSKQDTFVAPKVKIMGGDFIKVPKETSKEKAIDKKAKKDYSSGLGGLKNRKAEPESANVMKKDFLKSGRISLKK